jgi:hypothetical protein
MGVSDPARREPNSGRAGSLTPPLHSFSFFSCAARPAQGAGLSDPDIAQLLAVLAVVAPLSSHWRFCIDVVVEWCAASTIFAGRQI